LTLDFGLVDTIIPARAIGRYLADVVEGHDILELSGAIKGDAGIFLFVAREEDEGPPAISARPMGHGSPTCSGKGRSSSRNPICASAGATRS
jgi:hypothetical protein